MSWATGTDRCGHAGRPDRRGALPVNLTGLLAQGVRSAERLVVRDVLPVVFHVERQVVAVVRAHLEQVDRFGAVDQSPPDDGLPAAPTQILQTLLERSIYNRPDDNRNELYGGLLQALVPDEARILAALSDDSTYAVIHVIAPNSGSGSETILENASNVGRSAGVSLTEYVPLYLTRLASLGLVAIGPEGPASMDAEYEMLLVDDSVNIAQAKARRGIRGARILKRTVAITALGREIWEAAK